MCREFEIKIADLKPRDCECLDIRKSVMIIERVINSGSYNEIC